MQHIYDIANDIRDRCILDVTEIEGTQFASFDEYLLKFPQYRVLSYAYLKRSITQIKISTLHKLFGVDIGRWEHDPSRQLLLKSDKAYRDTMTKYFNDDYSWSTSTSLFRAMYFDAKRLNIKEYRDEASRQVERITAKISKHWSLSAVDLHSYSQINTHHDYHSDRMDTITIFWNEILSSVNVTDVEYIYFYDRFEVIIDTQHTVRIILCSNGQIDVDIVKPSGLVSGRNANVYLIRTVAQHPVIAQVLDSLLDNYSRINVFKQKLTALEQRHAHTVKRLKLIIRQFLQELADKEQYTYYNAATVQGVMLNDSAVTTYQFSYNQSSQRLNYRRSTHIVTESSERDQTHSNHIRTSYDVKNLDSLTMHLIRSGFINIYHQSYDIELDDYFALIRGETFLYNHAVFRLTFSEIAYICHKYFDLYHDEITQLVKLGYVDMQLGQAYEFKPPKRLDVQTLFEVLYAEKHAKEYENIKKTLQHKKVTAYKSMQKTVKQYLL